MQPEIKTHRAADGYLLHYRHWQPPGQQKAQIVYLHGIQSHGGWYETSCRRMCEAGYEVFFLDRRGSGLNQQDRGHAASAEQLVDDVARFIQQLREGESASQRVRDQGSDSQSRISDPQLPTSNSRSPGKPPTVLLAVSWGGKLAVAVAREAQQWLDGLALLYPGLASPFGPRRHQVALLRLACRVGLGRRQVPIPLDDPGLFTASPDWQRFIREDPLVLRRVTLQFLRASWVLDRRLRGAAETICVPTLMMLAGRDRIVENQAARRFFEGLATQERRLIEYPDAQHTLEFEADPEPFLRDLVEWLDGNCAKSRGA